MIHDEITDVICWEIAQERGRQREVEGFTRESDDRLIEGQLADAAACYAAMDGDPECRWPFSAEWYKPGDQRRNLIKAAALIVAEIERLDRLARR